MSFLNVVVKGKGASAKQNAAARGISAKACRAPTAFDREITTGAPHRALTARGAKMVCSVPCSQARYVVQSKLPFWGVCKVAGLGRTKRR